MRFWDLKQKEVINMCDCKKLGCVADLELDVCKGTICALIVPGPGRICGILGRETEFIIPWHDVKQIGEDIILVDVDTEKALNKCQY